MVMAYTLLQVDPDNIEAHHMLGWIYVSQGIRTQLGSCRKRPKETTLRI